MGNELRYVCLVETRRLLLLMGVVFGLILCVQYFELPYGHILSSIFDTNKSQGKYTDNFPSRDSSSNPTPSNVIQFSRNSMDLNVSNGSPTTVEASYRMDGSTVNVKDEFNVESGDDFVMESGKTLNDTFGKTLNDTLNDGIDPEDEISFKGALEIGRDSAIETAVRKHVGETDDGIVNEEEISKEETPESPQNPESNGTASIETSPNDSDVNTPKAEPSAMEGRLVEPEPEPAVVSMSEMNSLLLKSHLSYRAPKLRWSSPADQELQNARVLIENAPFIQNDPQLDVSLFLNFSAFKRSYELMEQTLKVYIYGEGERPIFHQPPLKGIYASEGWFMKLLKASKKFITKKPKKAHLFYLPFSSRMLEVALYVPDSHNRNPLMETLSNYIQTISAKYNFWNRTAGADHFLVACHDWAPAETRQIMDNCIRALCNADVKEGFRFGKDASLPETFIQKPQNPLRQLGGKPPSQRRILAFFAGNMHGYLRPILLNHWENKDPEMKIFGQIRKAKGQMSYAQYMKSSKYCICPRGFEVNSPRVVEAIFYECVPVIVSDNFVPPFFETLNWESFAVFVLEKDIPDLKNILESISNKRYLEMQRRVRKVQQHFLWHPKPLRYDVFHMVLHSIWYNRVFQTPS